MRSRWLAEGSGRADSYVTGGEFGPITYAATECWSDAFAVTYYTNNYDFVENGDIGECPFTAPSYSEEDPS